MPTRIGFVTCVRLGEEVLDEIADLGGSIDVIVTLPDDHAQEKSGRRYLDKMAQVHGAELWKTSSINDAATVKWLRDQALDWLFIIGWSQIATMEVLESARFGSLGMHPTLLPEGRGRASIPWAILKGLRRTGVSFFKLDEGVDSGPLIDQVEIPVSPTETATELYDKVVEAHRRLIRRNWSQLSQGDVASVPQDDSAATYWRGRSVDDGYVQRDMTVKAAERLARAVTRPYPGARWTSVDGRTWVIWAGTTNPREDGLRIPLQDGVYVATEFEPALFRN